MPFGEEQAGREAEAEFLSVSAHVLYRDALLSRPVFRLKRARPPRQHHSYLQRGRQAGPGESTEDLGTHAAEGTVGEEVVSNDLAPFRIDDVEGRGGSAIQEVGRLGTLPHEAVIPINAAVRHG